MFLFGT